MSNRITLADLRQAVTVLNRYHGHAPVEGYSPDPGRFILDRAYGGVKLNQYTEGGGERDVQYRRGTVRECHSFVQGMIAGCQSAGMTTSGPTVNAAQARDGYEAIISRLNWSRIPDDERRLISRLLDAVEESIVEPLEAPTR